MITRGLRLLNSSARERSLLVQSTIWLTLYRIGLWLLPFRVIRKWAVGGDSAGPARKSLDEHEITEIVRTVRHMSGYVPYASCLTQALAARRILGRYGQSAELKIGVAKSNGNFEAHAWLEVEGRIVIGRKRMHSRYAVLGTNRTLLRRV